MKFSTPENISDVNGQEIDGDLTIYKAGAIGISQPAEIFSDPECKEPLANPIRYRKGSDTVGQIFTNETEIGMEATAAHTCQIIWAHDGVLPSGE